MHRCRVYTETRKYFSGFTWGIDEKLPYILVYKSICFGSEKGAPRSTSTYIPDIVLTS